MTGISEEEAKNKNEKSRSEVRVTLTEFIDAVKDVIGLENGTDWDVDVKEYFGVDENKLISIETEFPLFKQAQACYAINKFLSKNTKVTRVVGYSGEVHCAPTYQEVMVMRDKTVPLLVRAWVFTKWRKVKLIVYVLFAGNYAEYKIFGLKKNNKTIHDLSTEVRKWMRENNFLRGEKLEFLPRGTLGFLDYGRNLNWKSIILSKELKDEMALNIIFPLSNEELCVRHNIPWRRGVLLAGIAGTGKTQFARVLCNVLDDEVTVIWATPKALYDEEKIKLLFDAARYFSPCLLIIEDIDFIGKSRDYVTDPTVGELLTQLDGNSPNHGVFVLATTNRPELLDKALIERPSRFDVKLIFELPNPEQRLEMIKYFCVGKRFNKVTHRDIVGMTNGFTGAYIKEVITYATLLSLKQNYPFIERKHLEKAIRQIREKIKPNRMST